MPPRPSSSLRRALGAGAVVVVLAVAGAAAAPAGAQDDPTSTDPGISTETVPTSDPAADAGDGTDTSTTVEDGTTTADADAAAEAAQDEADADLRSVWIIVAALGAVAVGLLVLLVLYVRATNPTRAARRQEALIARAEERSRGRAASIEDDLDDDDSDHDDSDQDVDDRTEVVAAAVAAPVVGAPPPHGAAAPAVLSRDPEETGDETVRVLGDVPAPVLAKSGPARPESPSAPITKGSGAGTRRRAKPLTAPPAGRDVAPAGPPPGPAEGDETVRIVPAPAGPTAVPASAGGGAVVGRGGSTGDRPPPRALVDSPPPPRRPRRVDAPAKKLGTPDAERVLVRPGQKPVRLPESMSKPGPRPEPDEEPSEPSDGDDAR